MLKFNSMAKVGFLIKNSLKSWLCNNYRTINLFKITAGLHKTIIIVSLAILASLFISSCKTCKCPAYSQIESQIPANKVDATV